MSTLLRRQFLVTKEHVAKLNKLSKAEGVPATEIVRRAIESYDSQAQNEPEMSALLALVSERLKDAIVDTQQTRTRLDSTLKQLEGTA